MFQKAKDYTLIGLKSTYCFLDDKPIVGKDQKENVKFLCSNVFAELMRKFLGITFPVCHSAKPARGWLGCHISQSALSPIKSKTSVILSLKAPKTLETFGLFFGSVHYITNLVPNLEQISHPFRSILQNLLILSVLIPMKTIFVKQRIASRTQLEIAITTCNTSQM